MKRASKWFETLLIIFVGLFMCYDSWGKRGMLPINEVGQIFLVICGAGGFFLYRTRQEKKYEKIRKNTKKSGKNDNNGS